MEMIDLVETFLPRVLSKLTLCVNSMATIMPTISRITGLDKYNLRLRQIHFKIETNSIVKLILVRLQHY